MGMTETMSKVHLSCLDEQELFACDVGDLSFLRDLPNLMRFWR